MNNKYLTLTFFLLASCIYSFNSFSQTDWAFSLPGGGFDSAIGFSVITDASENVYTTGQYSDSIDLDPGSGVLTEFSEGVTDVYVQKLDANGALVWAHSFGGAGTDSGTSIVVDDLGNLYLAGVFSGTVDFDPGANVVNLTSNGAQEVFILKLTNNGDFVWVKSFGGPTYDLPTEIALDDLGHIYTVGYFAGGLGDTIDFNPNAGEDNFICAGSSDMFIQKLDVDGNYLWTKTMGGSGFDRAYGITIDDDNNPIISGYFESTVDFDPNAGVTSLTSNGSRDIHITKLNSLGELMWAKSMGSSGFDGGFSLVSDEQNSIYATGFFEGSVDFDPNSGVDSKSSVGDLDVFVVKLSESGAYVWARSYGSSDEDYGRRIAIDNSSNIFLTGHFSSSMDVDLASGDLISEGATDIFIQKIDSMGTSLLANSFGGNGDDHCVSLTIDNSGKVCATGYFQISADFDASVGVLDLTAVNYQEVFIVKLALLGVLGTTPIANESEIQISPNPNDGVFNLTVDGNALMDLVDIEILNQFGQSALSLNKIEHSQQINLSNERSGVYFVRITSDSGVSVQKIVVN